MKKKFLIAIILFSLSILAFQTSPYARRIRPFSSTPSSCQENEIGYNMTSHSLVICTNSGYTALTTGSSGSFAPSNATYITQTANATLTNEQALSALATGLLKNTTTTGILSIGLAGTDYENPLTFNSPLSRATNAISCSTCALTSGNLSQFAATTSAQLAGVLSDESGSGVSLFATLSSLTANDVLTWNGSNWINQAVSGGGSIGSGNINMTVANDSGTGTTTGLLAKLTGAPSTVRNAQTSDTENAIGVCTSGCGTTGNATIAIAGQVSCQFDGSTTAGNYVVISSTSAGKCHDNGSSFPNDKAAYGRVLTTNVGAGTYAMTLMTPDIAFQNAGNGKSKPGGSSGDFQFNNSGVFAGGSLSTSGTIVQLPTTSWSLRWAGSGNPAITTNASGLTITNGEWTTSAYNTGGSAGSPAIYLSQNVGATGGLGLRTLGIIAFSSGTAGHTGYDVALGRPAAGFLESNDSTISSNGTEANLRDFLSRHFYTGRTTTGNCLDSAGAAACGAATGGNFVLDAAATTVVVSTTQVKADSQIYIQEDSSLGTRLSVTCNTTTGRDYTISARTAGTSFTVTSSAAPSTNPACLSYFIVN